METEQDVSVGDWVIEWGYDMQVDHRIACPERQYPPSEAAFTSIEEWEDATGLKWYQYLASIM